MKCRVCHEEKSPYKFDTHRLGVEWGKAEECRACTEIERCRVRGLNKKRHLDKLKPSTPLPNQCWSCGHDKKACICWQPVGWNNVGSYTERYINNSEDNSI